MSSGDAVNSDRPTTVLVVEPDEELASDLTHRLVEEQFRTVAARTGTEAIERLAEAQPNLVLMEWDLPDMAGVGLCRYIQSLSPVPLIVLSSHHSEDDAVASLEAGADDYLAKPFRWRELIARMGATMRRAPLAHRQKAAPAERGRVYVVGGITVDAERHEVWVGAQQVRLALREFQLLEALVASPGKVWTRDALMRRVWRETPSSGTKTLGVHITRLRARIEEDPEAPTRIVTVRGVGYTYAPGR